MIIRKIGLRQSRQLLALSRRAPISSRFQSTLPGTPVQTPQTPPTESIQPETPLLEVVQTPPTESIQPENPLLEVVQAQSEIDRAQGSRAASISAFNKLGSKVKAAYHPEDVLRNPPKPSQVTLELLLASGTHLGHSTSRWNPQNARYIFGIREGVHIISLDVTAAHLRRAARVVEEVAARGGLVLFAGTRKGQKRAVVRAAELAKGYHIFERWIPGTLTNNQQILGHCETKVVNALDEELPDFKLDLADRPALKPDLVVCLNPIENVVLLHECGLNNVPTIGVIDTDADPTRVTYPIPCNDDSLRATQLIAGILGRAGEAGQLRRAKMAEQCQTTYQPITAATLRLDPLSGRSVGAAYGQRQ